MPTNYPIMIVEDDQDDCDLIAAALQEIGVSRELRCFSNGEEALKFLQSTAEIMFLILSDINMPKMNGLELKKRINEDEELKKKSIPFIFLTTSVAERSVNQAYEMLVQGYFKKPDTFEEMKTLLSLNVQYWARCEHPNSVLSPV
jgi:CheY-like chemotaxis protein